MGEVWLAQGPAPTGVQNLVVFVVWSAILEGPDDQDNASSEKTRQACFSYLNHVLFLGLFLLPQSCMGHFWRWHGRCGLRKYYCSCATALPYRQMRAWTCAKGCRGNRISSSP